MTSIPSQPSWVGRGVHDGERAAHTCHGRTSGQGWPSATCPFRRIPLFSAQSLSSSTALWPSQRAPPMRWQWTHHWISVPAATSHWPVAMPRSSRAPATFCVLIPLARLLGLHRRCFAFSVGLWAALGHQITVSGGRQPYTASGRAHSLRCVACERRRD